jgi:2-succinyl-5-enolpyruvyl-6-hydroxy-3-cyclohexene-1-carboxylate synthase
MFSSEAYGALYERDRAGTDLLASLFHREPRAEPSLVRALSRLLPDESLMYVGNSLPIREWDLAAPLDRPRAVEANRGANGIDGQLSTFLRLLPEGDEGWTLVGDLTALYDLTAPWVLSGMSSSRVRFVVLNNGGGKIFSRIFKTALFENRHSLSFEGWAKMWDLPYELWTEVPAGWDGPKHAVIELKPDAEATARFWDAYDGFWVKP